MKRTEKKKKKIELNGKSRCYFSLSLSVYIRNICVLLMDVARTVRVTERILCAVAQREKLQFCIFFSLFFFGSNESLNVCVNCTETISSFGFFNFFFHHFLLLAVSLRIYNIIKGVVVDGMCNELMNVDKNVILRRLLCLSKMKCVDMLSYELMNV